jgi:hypothetical protein
MLTKVLIAWFLMAICVAIHAAGVTFALRWATIHNMTTGRRFIPRTRLFIQIAWWTILIHFLEIVVWALFVEVRHA